MSTVKCKYHFRFALINGFVTIVIIRRLHFIHTDETCLRTTELKTVRGTEKNCLGFVVVSRNITTGTNS